MLADDLPKFAGNFRQPYVSDLNGALHPMTPAEIAGGEVKSQ